LLKRVDFSADIERYGEPVAVSSSGLNFIVRRRDEDASDAECEDHMSLKVSIMNLSLFGMTHIKDIDVI
jgi:hypothetical protein